MCNRTLALLYFARETIAGVYMIQESPGKQVKREWLAMNPNSKKALSAKAPVDLTGEALAESPRLPPASFFKAGKLEKTDQDDDYRVLSNFSAIYGPRLNQQVSTLGGVIVTNNGMTRAAAEWKEISKATKEFPVLLI